MHRYVSLVGMALATASAKPGLPWKFIVLDTDAVNAFAAPGGFIHITKGALANLKDESELAGVLGHEIIHVTEKHTIRAIQKGKLVQMGANDTVAGNNVLMSQLVDTAYEVIENGFGRGEELEADEKGIVLANTVGYAPQGMNGFLTMLMERNKSGAGRNGLFASHPETKERIDKMTQADRLGQKLASTATVAERYTPTSPSSRWPPPRSPASRPDRPAPPAGTAKPAEAPKKKGLGGLGRSAQRRAAARRSRRRSPARARPAAAPTRTRIAMGGTNPALVAVTVPPPSSPRSRRKADSADARSAARRLGG